MNDYKLSLTSFQLKCIALVTMFLDHFGKLWRPFLSLSYYNAFRAIGRIAFPLYAFLLVEGFFYTRNREKYLLRLIIFSLVSEIPFDIGLHYSLQDQIPGILVNKYQNVFFTLSIGFIAMMYLSRAKSNEQSYCIIIITCLLGEFLSVDYGALGVLTILLFYYRRNDADLQGQNEWLCIPMLPLVISAYRYPIQLFCVLSLLPISLYNGKKGRSLKYVFYIFYPVHILLLYALRNFFFYR